MAGVLFKEIIALLKKNNTEEEKDHIFLASKPLREWKSNDLFTYFQMLSNEIIYYGHFTGKS